MLLPRLASHVVFALKLSKDIVIIVISHQDTRDRKIQPLSLFRLLFVPNSCRDYLIQIAYYSSMAFYIIRQKISIPNGQNQ